MSAWPKPFVTVAVEAIIGAPDAIAQQIRQEFVSAVEKQRVSVTSGKNERADYTVRGYFVAAKDKSSTKVSYIWDVIDPTGKRVNRITGEEVVSTNTAKDPWAALTPEVRQSIVVKVTSSFFTWLPTQNVASDVANHYPVTTANLGQPVTTASDPSGRSTARDNFPDNYCTQSEEVELSIKSCGDYIQNAQPNNPGLWLAFYMRAKAYGKKGDYERAMPDFAKAIALDSEKPAIYLDRGIVLLSNAQYDRAIADFTKVIELDDSSSRAYNLRATARLDQGLFQLAIADFSKAIDLSGGEALYYNNRAWAYFKFGRLLQAFSDSEVSLEKQPNQPTFLDTRGHIFEALGHREEAVADFRRALAKDPEQTEGKKALQRLGVAPLPATLPLGANDAKPDPDDRKVGPLPNIPGVNLDPPRQR